MTAVTDFSMLLAATFSSWQRFGTNVSDWFDQAHGVVAKYESERSKDQPHAPPVWSKILRPNWLLTRPAQRRAH